MDVGNTLYGSACSVLVCTIYLACYWKCSKWIHWIRVCHTKAVTSPAWMPFRFVQNHEIFSYMLSENSLLIDVRYLCGVSLSNCVVVTSTFSFFERDRVNLRHNHNQGKQYFGLNDDRDSPCLDCRLIISQRWYGITNEADFGPKECIRTRARGSANTTCCSPIFHGLFMYPLVYCWDTTKQNVYGNLYPWAFGSTRFWDQIFLMFNDFEIIGLLILRPCWSSFCCLVAIVELLEACC